MSIEIFMPALSPTMEKGTLAKWLVKEGDAISSGDVIAEIETDKATMELESAEDGIIAKLFSKEGTNDIPVGQVIALLVSKGENTSHTKTIKKISPPAPAADASGTSGQATNTPPLTETNGRVKASPLAKRIATQSGIDITKVTGSGPQGRIVKRDLNAALSAVKTIPSAPIATTKSPPPIIVDEYEALADIPFQTEKLSTIRKTIARRLTESKTTIPHFYLSIDLELDNLLSQRKILNTSLAEKGGKLSINDFIIRAAALSLKKVPGANAQYAGDKVYYYQRADISVAVAINNGLITPIIRGACSKGLADISSEMKDMSTRARLGKLMPEEYTGGTFSISNLGMHGIKEFGAVINPPQGAILAIGTGEQRPVIKDGSVAVATVMSCTLSCDHRVIDGAVGAEFLATFKAYMENPLSMLL
ncbi:MAG: pyruvate dehydrogenase complex dihydrolipoamide acetyltransferase [Alphaproteobacteria bacterium]|nr:MAG: pyruvate dehydrogenase complex dihydrolipoamide acetyltransferase [Alphaproteobacteria bacterium]